MSVSFDLDPRLAEASVPLGDLSLSAVRLMRDGNYPWLLLVPRRSHVVEVVDLGEDDRLQLMREIGFASAALKRVTGCDKLNVASIGNRVAQLHVHVIARFASDAAWPDPVWGARPALERDAEETAALLRALSVAFGAALSAAED